MVGMSMSCTLNENEEDREITRNSGIFVSRFNISSEIPSAKYSLPASSLMLTNGSTAMDLSMGASTNANLSKAKYPSATARTAMTIQSNFLVPAPGSGLLRSTSFSSLTPAGVTSKTHASISAIGKPIVNITRPL